MAEELSFQHVYQPPTSERSDSPTLLVLHGTGGSEMDLLPLARTLAPQAGVLSPRGKVLERGMPRFFRRLSEGVFDVEDLKFRAGELADFIAAAAVHYNFDARRVVAAGFSNGANIAGSPAAAASRSARRRRPVSRDGAAGARRAAASRRERRCSFATAGATRWSPPLKPSASRRCLTQVGAAVTIRWQPGGHELTPHDVHEAKRWLDSLAVAAVSS